MMGTFLAALGLVFVFEGLLPFVAPALWRRIMLQMITQNNRMVRLFGLVSMLAGVAILYLI